MNKFYIILLSAWLVAACDDPASSPTDTGAPPADSEADNTQVDTPQDTEPPPTLEGTWLEIAKTERPDGQTADGAADLTSDVAAGEVRAGRVDDDSERITGVFARCRVGDFKLMNAKVAFCIEGPVGSSHVLFGGGHLIDAVRLDVPDAQDHFLLSTPDLNLRAANYNAVEVAHDGSGGGPAVIRSSGEDDAIALLFGLLGSPQLALPGDGTQVTTEYRLLPDSEVLEIITWVSHPTRSYRRPTGQLMAYDESIAYYPGNRIDANPPTRTDFFGGIAPGASYGYFASREGNAIGINELESAVAIAQSSEFGIIPAGLEGAYRHHIVVGDGSTFSVFEAMERYRGETVARTPVTLSVTQLTSGTPVPQLVFEVLDGTDTSVGVAQTGADGVASFNIPPGDYTLAFQPWTGGAIDDVSLSVADTPVTLDIDLPDLGSLTVNAFLDDATTGAPLPVKVEVGGRTIHAHNGTADIPLAPGDYTVSVSRGTEYTAHSESVTLTATNTTAIDVALSHVLDTPGRVAGEFHQHARPSVDSTLPVDQRVYANLTDGVDFMVPTDHDIAYDYESLCSDLGLDGALLCINGTEVSPVYGHINGIGVRSDPNLPSWGALSMTYRDAETGDLKQRTPFEIDRDLRAEIGADFVQINHPREDSALLNSQGFDPNKPLDEISEEKLPRTFDFIEVFNGKRADIACTVLKDWYSLHNQGYRLIMVGNSDSHDEGRPAGFPRNYIGVSDDTPANLTEDIVFEGLRARDVTVSAGAVIELGTGWRVGETRSVGAGSTQSIPVTVKSPPWSRITDLVVVVNGVPTERLTLDPAEADIVDFDGTLDVVIDADAYVHLIAFGRDRMSAVYGEKPYALTNPIYFDVDGDTDNNGDGYEPPGFQTVSDLDYDFCNR